MIVAEAGWPDVVIALIASIPTTLTVYLTWHIRRQIKTPSGRSIGKQMEDTNHTSRSNWHYLQSMHRELSVPTPAAAEIEAAAVEGLHEERQSRGSGESDL